MINNQKYRCLDDSLQAHYILIPQALIHLLGRSAESVTYLKFLLGRGQRVRQCRRFTFQLHLISTNGTRAA